MYGCQHVVSFFGSLLLGPSSRLAQKGLQDQGSVQEFFVYVGP